MPTPPPALVCTGFHRSGTSLAAKRLQRAGLPLGERLLPAHPSNPDGHFEDGAVVDLHDAWLAREGTDWLHRQEAPPTPDPALAADIAAYVESRDAAGSPWALKDPRLTLALPSWAGALGERGRYLLLVRHWAECAQSLFQRHSREMAHHLYPTRPGANGNFRFWLEPNVAYEAWLAYNRQVLEFAARHPGRTLVSTSRGFAALGTLQEVVVAKLGVPLAVPDADPGLRRELMARSVRAAVLPAPPLWLRRSLDVMWQELLAIAECRAPEEAVDWEPRGAPHWVRHGIDSIVADRFPHRKTAAPPAMAAGPLDSNAALLPLLPLLPPSVRLDRAMARARTEFAARRYDEAEAVLRAAIDAGANPVSPLLLLGDIEMARREPQAALRRYQEALALRSTPPVLTKAIRCLIALQRWEEAVTFADRLVAATPDDADAQLLQARCIEALRGPDAAAGALRAMHHPGAAKARVQMTMAHDEAAGMRMYRDLVRSQLEDGDLPAWLASACASIGVADAWNAFVEAVLPHWYEMLPRSDVHHRLGLHPLPDEAGLDALLAPDHRLPPVLVGGHEGRPLRALGAALRTLGWHLGDRVDADGELLAFTAAFDAPDLVALPGDHSRRHAAGVSTLEAVHDELRALSAPPSGWGWIHGANHWFADQWLHALPTLHYLHVIAPPLTVAASAGTPDFRRWAAREFPGEARDAPYWRMKHAVAVTRRFLELQAAFPERVLAVTPGAKETARELRRWVGRWAPAPLPPGWPGARLRSAGERRAVDDDLSAFDPRDIEFLRGHGLLASDAPAAAP